MFLSLPSSFPSDTLHNSLSELHVKGTDLTLLRLNFSSHCQSKEHR